MQFLELSFHIRLAVSLPPSALFCGCRDGDVTVVASFVQQTLVSRQLVDVLQLVPHLALQAPVVQTMMVLPFHITHYLLQVCAPFAAGFLIPSSVHSI